MPDASKPPTVAALVDQYRALPGITRSDRDGARFAWLVRTFPAERVRAVLVTHGPTLAVRARKDPISLLYSILKTERTSDASARSNIERTAALVDSLTRVDAERSAETEAMLDEIRASLGVPAATADAPVQRPALLAKETAHRAGMALIGEDLPPMPQRIPEEAVPA